MTDILQNNQTPEEIECLVNDAEKTVEPKRGRGRPRVPKKEPPVKVKRETKPPEHFREYQHNYYINNKEKYISPVITCDVCKNVTYHKCHAKRHLESKTHQKNLEP